MRDEGERERERERTDGEFLEPLSDFAGYGVALLIRDLDEFGVDL